MSLALAILNEYSKYMLNEAKRLELEIINQEAALNDECMAVVMASESMKATYNQMIKAAELYASAIIGYADMLKRKMGKGNQS